MIFAAELVKRTKNVMFLIVNAKVEHFARKPANSVVFYVIRNLEIDAYLPVKGKYFSTNGTQSYKLVSSPSKTSPFKKADLESHCIAS